MQIRKANIRDVPALVDMWNEFMQTHDKIVTAGNPRIKQCLARLSSAADCFRKFVTKKIRSKDSIVFIAETSNRPAGYTLVEIKKSIPIFKIKKKGNISDIFVRKELRGTGVSTKLKNTAVQWCKSKKLKYLTLDVFNDNPHAHAIYKKWGFFEYHIQMWKKI